MDMVTNLSFILEIMSMSLKPLQDQQCWQLARILQHWLSIMAATGYRSSFTPKYYMTIW
jgi:hypothetical protein